MSSGVGLQCLRPYLFRELPVARKLCYIRFYHTTRRLAAQAVPGEKKTRDDRYTSTQHMPTALPLGNQLSGHDKVAAGLKGRVPVEQRVEELKAANALVYPRIQRDSNALSCEEFSKRYAHLKAGEQSSDAVTIRGRVQSVRSAGKKLLFLDIVHNARVVQAVCNLGKFGVISDVSTTSFRTFSRLIRRGDIISVSGNPSVTSSGELSVNAGELPTILSPTLPLLPTSLEDRETRIRNRHVDLLVNKNVADTLRIRSHIIQYVRDFLRKDDFLEVQTPIIVDSASGAAAKPFTTAATEFQDRALALRIAPEIWLKRLVLGGMDRVFEIGPAFRNEGLDATHNPEFTTCEFYKSFADLEDLILMTEQMVSGLAERVKSLRESSLRALPELDASLFTTPYKRIEFIPAVEAALGQALPDLAAEDATKKLLAILFKHDIPAPSPPTLPRLLDKLASVYIEPQCEEPTFIMHHPACMAPLSKSFLDPATKQVVSARVELFIHQKEIANMYEEENSPFEQRKKLVQQALLKDEESGTEVDESYLEALEWALPPTGGWGSGIDRICMLFSGSSRISDVLAFGSLKNVVNLGKANEEEEGVGKEVRCRI